jgi:hypothetical protein
MFHFLKEKELMLISDAEEKIETSSLKPVSVSHFEKLLMMVW